jgi:outer membrane protease
MRNITVFTVLVSGEFFKTGNAKKTSGKMFRFLLLFISFHALHAIPPVSAQEITETKNSFYALSLTPLFGIFYGQAEEIVYPTNTKGDKLSQLLWDMKPLWYYGISLDFAPVCRMERRSFFLSFSLKTGIGGITGVMEDRDWMSKENDSLTHYSIHDNETREMFAMEMAAGLSFPLRPRFLIRSFINLSYMRFSFSGWDGHGVYAKNVADGTFNLAEKETYRFNGKVINYTQEWIIFAPAFSFGLHFLEFFYADISFQISPFILCTDMDEHLTMSTMDQYKDFMRWGLYLEPRGRFAFTANKWLSLSLEIAWKYIDGSRGEIYSKPYGSGYYEISANKAGAGLSLLDTCLLFKVRL